MNLGPVELLVILGIVLLLFGARRLPDLARSLGKSTKEFKRGMHEGETHEGETEEPPHEERTAAREDRTV